MATEMSDLSAQGKKFSEKTGEDYRDDAGAASDDGEMDVLEFTPLEKRTLLKKLNWRVVGLISFLYLLSFLDRSNIGNAKIAGLMTDLKLNDEQYGWLLTAFYITYITFEWMALLFKLVRPHVYLTIVVLCWGIIASLQSLTTNFTQILLLRTSLGIAEAAFCGVPFYLSFFFRREELASRIGLFIAAAPLATSCASSIAWVITSLASISPIAPWRLLFLVEGFPSVIVAWYCFHNVADSPGTAWFLTPKEREYAVLRLQEPGSTLGEESHDEKRSNNRKSKSGINFSEIAETLRDPKSYLTAAMYFSCNVAFSSMPVFLPTIIQQMGHTQVMAQALSAPPYLVAFVVVLSVSYISDKRGARSPYIVFFALMASAGYALIVLAGVLGLPNWIRYFGLYPACIGFFTCITLLLAWTLNNQESESKKGTGIAILQFLGQCGPLVGTRLFPATDGPLYVRGMATCSAFMAGVACLALSLRVLLKRENERRINQAMAQDIALGEDVEEPLVGPDRGGPFMNIL
ncbi:MFS transporter [Microthyrium microscopicum]|uniref:MFS transporter n=1 Tax=Microthyrium microscopicum TaxID=703497 RepID=A0A6A6ULH7_9PEZI|nr:MFS transporter [Microthyrium microscopicum]